MESTVVGKQVWVPDSSVDEQMPSQNLGGGVWARESGGRGVQKWSDCPALISSEQVLLSG